MTPAHVALQPGLRTADDWLVVGRTWPHAAMHQGRAVRLPPHASQVLDQQRLSLSQRVKRQDGLLVHLHVASVDKVTGTLLRRA